MEVQKDINKLPLSPIVVAILATSTTLSICSPPARGETEGSVSSSTEETNLLISQPSVAIEIIKEDKATESEQSATDSLKKPETIEISRQEPQEPYVVVDAVDSQEEVTAEGEQLTTDSLKKPEAIEVQNQESQVVVPEVVVAEDSKQLVVDTSKGSESILAQNQESNQEPRVLVAEVVVSGAEGELQDLVYDKIRTQPGRPTTRSQLQEDVNAIYATGFFANVTVTPEDTPLGVRITFDLEPNPVLSKVVIDTIPSSEKENVLPPEVIEEIFSDRYGETLNLSDLQADIKDLNEWYKENGYDLAQVVGSPEVSEDGTVTLIVAEGLIEDVQVRFFDEEGETVEGKTRDFIVTREVELKPGDIFNRNTAQNDLQRVFGLGLFEDVRLSFSPGEDPSKVVVNVDVVESNSGSLAAGAGVSSASGLFGTVSYQQQNLGGNNQRLGAEFQLGTRELLFDARFTDPWIGGDPFRTSYTVNGFRRRSISLIFDGGENEVELPNGDRPRVVRTGGGINFSRPLPANPYARAEWRLSAGLQYQRIEIRDSDGEISPLDELGNELSFSGDGSDDLFTLQFGATRDRRNNPLQPTNGYLLRLGVDQSIPVGSGSIFLNRIRGSYSYYIPVNLLKISDGPQALAFNIQGGTVLGDLPPYEAFSLGGSNSVRGYDEGDVGSGRSFLQATAEYRFPIIAVVGGALFVDFGTDLGTGDNVIGDPAGARDKPGSGLGYGIGVRIQSPLGPIRIDYGLNDQGENRLHFGIGERF